MANILSFLGPVVNLIGTGIKGIFGLKKEQSDLLGKSLELIGSIQSDEAKAHVAAMAAIVAEARSESFLTRIWRPMAFIGFLVMLFLYFFGYAPENILGDTLPPLVDRIFGILEIVLLAGYPARTIDKMTREIQLGSLLRTFITKKIL